MAQIHVMPLSHALSARPNGEPAGRAERHNRDHWVFAELGLVVGVRPHALIAIPVTVGQDTVEGHAGPLADASQESSGCRCEGSRLERLPRVAIAHVAGSGEQARLEDPPPKQHDLTLLPGQLVTQGRQHGVRLPGRKPNGSWSSQAPNASEMRMSIDRRSDTGRHNAHHRVMDGRLLRVCAAGPR